MARDISSAWVTALEASEGYAEVWLLEINTSGGVTRLSTAPVDIDALGETWTGLGGTLELAPEQEESPDFDAQSLELKLSAVDQTILAAILNNNYRGREFILYFGTLDVALGTLVDTPLEAFRGLLNDPWEFSENPEAATGGPGTAEIRTRVRGELSAGGGVREIRTNVSSHNAALERAGETAGDTFFQHVPGLENRTIAWGRESVNLGSSGGGTGDDFPTGDETQGPNETKVLP